MSLQNEIATLAAIWWERLDDDQREAVRRWLAANPITDHARSEGLSEIEYASCYMTPLPIPRTKMQITDVVTVHVLKIRGLRAQEAISKHPVDVGHRVGQLLAAVKAVTMVRILWNKIEVEIKLGAPAGTEREILDIFERP